MFKLSSELTAMLILLKNRDRFEQFRSEVKLSHLTDKDAQMLYTVLEDAIRQEIRTDDMILQMIDDPDLRNLAVSAFTNKMYQRMDIDKSLSIAIYRIKLNQLEDKKAMIQRLLMGGEMDNADEKEFSNLLQMKISVDKDIQELKAEMEDKE